MTNLVPEAIRISFADRVFAYRVAGVATSGERILLHKAEHDEFWTLPGGACGFGEDSKSALKRELREELGAEVEVGRLLWVVENFFEYEGRPWHEVGLYYEIRLVGASETLYGKAEFEGVESSFKEGESLKLLYKWMSHSSLVAQEVRPRFLKEALLKIPSQTEMIVNRD
ncbi:MAG: NUDIX hydrolase [Oligoflexia bacterium]|nr:NUDIX hydrolase [Oligoflexia bacterium]